MKHEQLLTAIGNIDDQYLREAEAPAKPAHTFRRFLIAAACLALVCVSAALWMRSRLAPTVIQDDPAEQTDQSACVATSEDAMRAELQHTDAQQLAEMHPAELPIAENTAIYLIDYSCVSAEAQEVLMRYRGEPFYEQNGHTWYRTRDTQTLKYLICETENELQLWRFGRFAGSFTAGQIYETIFCVSKAEDLTAITVNGGTIWDAELLRQFYDLTRDVAFADSGAVLSNAVAIYPFSAGMYAMDGWLYDPAAGVLSIYGATSEPLPAETVQALNTILGIG